MTKFYSAGGTDALVYAIKALHDHGIEFLPCPDEHVTHLLLPVPSFDTEGRIRGGGDLGQLLTQLPQNVKIIGGNLDRPELDMYQKHDLLKDPHYVSENASITAYCALTLAMERLPCTLRGLPVLVIGWGRIGKCLAKLLQGLRATVTVATRKETDRAMLEALGYRSADTSALQPEQFRLILNTAPVMILPSCPGKALKIDLASQPGIGGKDVIWARGLPGTDAPESSGMLIADTILQYVQKGVII